MEQPSPSAEQIAKVVGAIGKRAALARTLPLVAIAIAGGLTGFSLILALTRTAHSGLLLAMASLTLLVVLGLVAWSWRRAGNLRRIARRTDIRLHLNEALSTTIGLTPGNQNAVTRAQAAHASGVAGRIDIGRAIPLFTRSMALAIAVLTSAIFGASAAYSLIGPAALPPAAEAASAEPAPQETIAADDIDVLARLIADDAERRDSDYLKAVANSLQELAQAARDGTPPQQLHDQLDALLDHAAAGYDGRMPDWMSANTADASALIQNARAFSQARQQAALARQQAQGDTPTAGSSSADMYNLPEDRLVRSASTPPPGTQPPPKQGEGGEREGGLESASLNGGDFAATPMQDEAFESAGALPVGAAAQSGKGESNIAGGGSQPLAPDSGFLQSMPDPSQAMSIAADDPQSGSRIRLHVPTGAELSDTASLGGDLATDWARQSAQSVSRQKVSANASALVARYFNRLIQSPAPVQ
ncbi:hypothetical protein GCM10007913_07050 [Devosia yakushimensis]|uniref:Uncharacterized protein n=1 Tax=Devosia yakushimensis TaxID=470028 RepID=A0ABQ5UAX7_9HYPH|nr:hypothetical protein [Devosia yakushimensis]GLQ08773.1 hypothetical protein GCM10007913_07050 [Devosia yakushimensis]